MIKASEWIESKTEYAYNSTTKLFSQPALSTSILNSLVTTNPNSLASIKSKTQIGKYKSGTSIAEICKQVKNDHSVEILEGVLATLAEQTQAPVLVAIDEVQALFSTSGLKTPDYRTLESYDLSIPRLFLDYLTGQKTFVSTLLLLLLLFLFLFLFLPLFLLLLYSIHSPAC
jgi:small subunit ribosomal protein S29